MQQFDLFDIIERINLLIRAEERKKCAALGLQPVHLQVLQYLSYCNRFSNTAVAMTQYLGRTMGSVSQTLSLLEKNGLIKKIPNNKDHRVVNLQLTNEGRKILELALPDELFIRASSLLGNEEALKQCADYFNIALNALQKAYQLKSFGVCKSCQFHTKIDEGSVCSFHKERLSKEDSEKICKDYTVLSWWH